MYSFVKEPYLSGQFHRLLGNRHLSAVLAQRPGPLCRLGLRLRQAFDHRFEQRGSHEQAVQVAILLGREELARHVLRHQNARVGDCTEEGAAAIAKGATHIVQSTNATMTTSSQGNGFMKREHAYFSQNAP